MIAGLNTKFFVKRNLNQRSSLSNGQNKTRWHLSTQKASLLNRMAKTVRCKERRKIENGRTKESSIEIIYIKESLN